MKTAINLLPHVYRREQMIRRRLLQWGVVVVLVISGVWFTHTYEMREYRSLAQQLDVLERTHRPIKTLLKEITDMRQQLDRMNQQEIIAIRLETQRNVISLLGVVSQTTKKADGQLRVTKFQLTDLQADNARAEALATDLGTGKLVLSGVALDSPAVAELLDGLQTSEMFLTVELNELKEATKDGVAMNNYRVECEF